ncbi:DUF1016 domain-containing protein (plasmid) [Candidatus Trichorickettsia mobilis]|nr:DUF1016 domain-containing protein [Candidatus Trichorickettsia mobilis]
MIKYTLGAENKQIFASKYQFHLPTEEELAIELRKEVEGIKQHIKLDYSKKDK